MSLSEHVIFLTRIPNHIKIGISIFYICFRRHLFASNDTISRSRFIMFLHTFNDGLSYSNRSLFGESWVSITTRWIALVIRLVTDLSLNSRLIRIRCKIFISTIRTFYIWVNSPHRQLRRLTTLPIKFLISAYFLDGAIVIFIISCPHAIWNSAIIFFLALISVESDYICSVWLFWTT